MSHQRNKNRKSVLSSNHITTMTYNIQYLRIKNQAHKFHHLIMSSSSSSMHICTRFQHSRSGSFSCLTFFTPPNYSNNKNSSSSWIPPPLLIAGDTDGLAHFYNLKTMKLIAVLNVNSDQSVCRSGQGQSVGNLFLPVPKSPQGLLSMGVEYVNGSSSRRSSEDDGVGDEYNNKNHFIFWAQSRSMQVFVFDLKKHIFGHVDGDSDSSDDESSDEDEGESDEQEDSNNKNSALITTTSHQSSSSFFLSQVAAPPEQIPTLAVIGPFNNFSFAPSLCLRLPSSSSSTHHSPSSSKPILFLCPHELAFRGSNNNNENNGQSSSDVITNGALYFSVIGENELMFDRMMKTAASDTTDEKKKKKLVSKMKNELHMAMRGSGEILFHANSHLAPPKLGQLMTMEKVMMTQQEPSDDDHKNLCVASFESGDVILFDVNAETSRESFYDSKVQIRILAKIRVASEPIMSLLGGSMKYNNDDSMMISVLCGSAEGNLVHLEFISDDATKKNVLQLKGTLSTKLEAGIGTLVSHNNNKSSNNNSSSVECFLWNGERKTIELVSKNDCDASSSSSSALLGELKVMNRQQTEEYFRQNNDTATYIPYKNFVTSAIASCKEPKITQLITSVSQDAEVRKTGTRRNDREEVMVMALARKGGEISLVCCV